MQRHWLVTLQNLTANGRSWDADVPQALLQDNGCGEVNVLAGLRGDVHWQLSLQRKAKAFYLKSEWQAILARSCSRCNADFDWTVTGLSERLFQFTTADGFGALDKSGGSDADDESTSEYIDKPGEINLLDVLREDVWLAWKADVICSDSCKGLCQGCGVNLNTDACQCKQDNSDHPFAALQSLKLE